MVHSWKTGTTYFAEYYKMQVWSSHPSTSANSGVKMHSQNGKDKETPQCTSELDNELCPTVQLLSKILLCDGEQVDHSKILLREQVE